MDKIKEQEESLVIQEEEDVNVSNVLKTYFGGNLVTESDHMGT